MIAFWLGKAISENDRLLPGKGRFRVNPEYQAFKESVAWVLRKQHLDNPPVKGPVCVRLFIELNPGMDAQNILKPVFDALELAGVIKNDRQIRTFSCYREDRTAKEEDRIGILIQEMKE